MAKRRNNKNQTPRKKGDQEVQAIYDRVRREFTAADLQKYTEIEKGISLEHVIAQMEEIHRKVAVKRRA